MNTTTVMVVFVSYLILDGLYVIYTRSAAEGRAVKSATIGAIMYAIAAYGIVSFAHDWRYIFPLIVGSWIGTFTAVKIDTKAKK